MADTKPLDIVYILSERGSHWQNNEIRFSLRSLEKNVLDYRKVYIIGFKPDFLNDEIVHIPYADTYKNKARNIAAKIRRAAGCNSMTKNFMLWNDDYFALKQFSAINYPHYYKCGLDHSVMINKGEYKLHCEATLKVLKENGLTYKNFDCHYPITYDKLKVVKMVDQFNWNVPYGFVFRSMYCNFYSIPGEMKQDCKINHPMPLSQIEKKFQNEHFLSIGEGATNIAMRSYLISMFPNKSRYEK